MTTGTQDYTRVEQRSNATVARQGGRRAVFGMDADRVATGLGWFSIGLGVAELIAPRSIARLVGARNGASWIRGYGLREIGAGIGLLAFSQRAPWLWARVAGDALDLASLGRVAASGKKNSDRAWFHIAAVTGVTALDVCCAVRHTQTGVWKRAEANMIVDRPPENCYSFWRNFTNLPRFMSYLESVQTTGDRTSHWVASAPGGARIEWYAEIETICPTSGSHGGPSSVRSSATPAPWISSARPATAARSSAYRWITAFRSAVWAPWAS